MNPDPRQKGADDGLNDRQPHAVTRHNHRYDAPLRVRSIQRAKLREAQQPHRGYDLTQPRIPNAEPGVRDVRIDPGVRKARVRPRLGQFTNTRPARLECHGVIVGHTLPGHLSALE